jgi:hypothetical protein
MDGSNHFRFRLMRMSFVNKLRAKTGAKLSKE